MDYGARNIDALEKLYQFMYEYFNWKIDSYYKNKKCSRFMMNCKECFLWNAMGSEDRKRIDAEMKYCEEAYNYVWGDRNYLKNNDLPQIHGGFGRYRALKLRQAVLNKQHIIQIAPMYENTQTVIDEEISQKQVSS